MNPVYASIDVETLGLDPENDSLLSVAVVLDDFETPITELPRLHIGIIQPFYMASNLYAMKMNYKTICDILSGDISNVQIDYLKDYFKQFLNRYGYNVTMNNYGKLESEKKLLVAGKNFGSFDYQFLKDNMLDFSKGLSYSFLDVGSMFYKPGKSVPTLEQLKVDYQIPGTSHVALDDALTVVHLMREKYCTTQFSIE